MASMRELTSEECLRLLTSGVFGRAAVTTPTGPQIVPVNYSVVKDRVVFRTTPYSVLGSYGRNALMAFEVDHVDYEYGNGWSVVARGRANVITDPQELDVITSTWTPRPWARSKLWLASGASNRLRCPGANAPCKYPPSVTTHGSLSVAHMGTRSPSRANTAEA